jgi:hypothetical protein
MSWSCAASLRALARPLAKVHLVPLNIEDRQFVVA